MAEPIKQPINVFGAYSGVNDWGFEEPKATVEVYVANSRANAYVTLSVEEAHQAIEILKDAIKEAEKELKKMQKREDKRSKRSGRERF
jgi:hypothetical protein